MKAAKPSPSGTGPNQGPARKRYFVNIVTEEQILAFQNEVSERQPAPLLAPSKREHRLLILAPNTETVGNFQRRVLTQFQYNTNVSADAVRLLEAHFCEVPKSYSVADALDARSEAYLVVDNIKPLGPGLKRSVADSIGAQQSPPASPRGEPSAKRQRRREKQAVKLASVEPENADNASAAGNASQQSHQQSHQQSSPPSTPSSDSSKALPAQPLQSTRQSIEPAPQQQHTTKPLFGRTRAENERRPSSSAPDLTLEKPDNTRDTAQPVQATPTRAASAVKRAPAPAPTPALTPVRANADTAGTSNKKTAEPAQETPKSKPGRTANTDVQGESSHDTAAAAKPSRNGKARPSKPSREQDQASKDPHAAGAVEPEMKSQEHGATKNGLSAPSSVASAAKSEAAAPLPALKETEKEKDNDDTSESDSSAASDDEDSDSSGSESDSGERQRRLSRRRVVAVANGAAQAHTSDAPPTSVNPTPEKAHKEPREQKETPRPTQAPAGVTSGRTAAVAVANDSADNAPGSSNDLQQRPSRAAPSRVPGLGSLADLANMRLPTVHETGSRPAADAASAKKPSAEESSEEEEDNNDSDDSNDSDGHNSSTSDSSDEDDESTAGGRNRRRGLLGLLRKK